MHLILSNSYVLAGRLAQALEDFGALIVYCFLCIYPTAAEAPENVL